ncbi:MAG: tetratricopeptide repeat protein [Holophagae bacterium]|jgi:tetratricopeptide (TPR) repeat protein
MLHTRVVIFCVAVCVAAAAVPSLADEPEKNAADRVRDEALSQTVGWRPKAAETTLNHHKSDDVSKSQPYLTAHAFLMAAYGVNQDQDTVKRGLEILNQQVKRDPTDPIAEYCRGEVLDWLEKPDQARAAWAMARDLAADQIKKDSRDPTAHYYRGAALVRLKKPDEAIGSLKKAARFGFDPAMVNFELGLAYLLQERWNPAKKAFDDVHSVDPRFAHLYFYRGLAWEKLGRKDQMLKDFNQFVALAPNAPEAKTAMAVLSAMR